MKFPHRNQNPQRNWVLGWNNRKANRLYPRILRRIHYVDDQLHAAWSFQAESDDFLSTASLTPYLTTRLDAF